MTLHSQLATFLPWIPTTEGFYSALEQCHSCLHSPLLLFIFFNERCWLVLTDATKSNIPIPRTNKDWLHLTCVYLVAQLYATFCNPMDCSLPGSSLHGHSPGKNTGVGCHALFQGIFPMQGVNPGLFHCRWVLYHLSQQGSPCKSKPRPMSQDKYLTKWTNSPSSGSDDNFPV